MKKEEIYVEQPVEARPSVFSRLSWGSIFAGVFVTLATALMLSLLGIAVGAHSIQPLNEQQPVKGLGIGTLVWLAVTAILSLFFGAWVAGRSAGAQRRGDGFIHGLVTWGVTTICVGFLTTTTLGTLLGGASSFIGKTASTASQSGVNWDSLKHEVQANFPQAKDILTPTGQTNEAAQPDDQRAKQNPKVLAAMTKMFAKGGAAQAPAEREAAVNSLMSEENMSRQDAEQQVNDWDQKYQQTKAQAGQKVREAGDVAARGISWGALGCFGLLFLCALAAIFGGRAGEASAFRQVRRVVVATT